MEWIFFAGGALTLIVIKLFISWLGLLMKLELQRREIKRLNLALKMHGVHKEKLESMWLNAEDRAENAGEIWPDIVG